MAKKVVLVDKNDNELGLMEKLDAHRNPGTLHRAISAVLYRDKGNVREILIQKRSKKKLLWPEYWDSACSTHPWEKESYERCAKRRLREEMGINIGEEDAVLVDKLYYQADYSDQLSEHELNGILIGEYEGSYSINEDEVSEARWVSWDWLRQDMIGKEDMYAPWFILMIPIIEEEWGSGK